MVEVTVLHVLVREPPIAAGPVIAGVQIKGRIAPRVPTIVPNAVAVPKNVRASPAS